MSTLAATIGRGVTGSRPAASEAGRLYFDTTTSIAYRDNGSSWDTAIPGSLTNPMTTTGDIVYSSDNSGTPARLAAVATGQALISKGTGTAPAYGYAPFHGCRVTHSGSQAMTSGAYVILNMDTESYDSDAFHFTSSANLTGTVTKTASSAALVGSSTLFTSELSVGQVISVPGTAAERRVVTVITDNTHLTVASIFSNSASGQTATRVNSAIVNPFSGTTYYRITGNCSISASPGAGSFIVLAKNAASAGLSLFAVGPIPNDSVEGEGVVTTDLALAQWDFVELHLRVGAAAINAQANGYSPFLSMAMIGQ